MLETLSCSQGHQWTPSAESPVGATPFCPVCGQPALPHSRPPENIGDTLAYSKAPDTSIKKNADTADNVPKPEGETRLPPATLPIRKPADEKAAPVDTAASKIIVPGYEVVRELGRGGMGVVYLARQAKLGRLVALKMILSGAHAGSDELARFRAEAEVIARVQHPNLVQIYEVGELEGRPYFSLEYVDGGDLDSKFEGKPQPPDEAAKLTSTLARAVHAAHQHQIIHRDLKPGNVLLTADGIPKITDFGLAKRLDDNSGQTRTGAIMGTPSYMAPEQAAGRLKDIGPHTDVFSLGAMLYEFLTGRPPFLADTAWDTVLQAAHQDPVPPSRLRAKVPRDLETICLKCLEKDHRKRYQSAADLADDLDRYLRHEPIRARPTGAVERLIKWARRRPATAVSCSLGLLVVVGLLVFGFVYHLKVQREEDENRQSVVRLSVTNGAVRIKDWDWFGALVWYTYAFETSHDKEDIPMHRQRLASTVRGTPKLVQLWNHEGSILHASFSPDSKFAVTSGTDDCARVHNLTTGEQVCKLDHQDDVVQGWFSPNGELVLTASVDGTAQIWNARTGARVNGPLEHGRPLRCAYFSPDGKWVVTAGHESRERTAEENLGLTHGTVLTPSQKEEGPKYPGARIWDAKTGKEVEPALKHKQGINWACFSPNGLWVATASSDHTAQIWDLATRKPLWEPLIHDDIVTHVVFSPDNNYVVTSSDDNTARLWRTGTLKPDEPRLAAVLHHSDIVKWGAFRGDSKRVVTVSDDSTARIWSVPDGRLLVPPMKHGSNVRRYAAFSPDGCWVLTSGDDNTARLWDASSGLPFTTNLIHNGTVHCFVLAPNGHLALSVSDAGMARLWDLAVNDLRQADLDSAAASARAERRLESLRKPDPRLKIDGTKVEIMDPNMKKPTGVTLPHDERVLSARFSPNGRWVATACVDHTAHIWEASTGKLRKTKLGEDLVLHHGSVVTNVAFSPIDKKLSPPDSRYLATCSNDNTARVWIIATGEMEAQPLRHDGSLNDVAFDATARRVATAANDRSARVWDVLNGSPLTPPLYHPRAVREVVFGDDNRSLLTLDFGGKSYAWDLPQDERPMQELVKLAELLDGNRINDQSEFLPLERSQQIELWKALQPKSYEELRPASFKEILAWHKARASDCEEHGEPRGALWHLETLIEAEPNEWHYRLRRGNAYAELDEWDLAMKDFRHVVEHAPDQPVIISRLALIDLRVGENTKLKKRCKKMLEGLGPKSTLEDIYRVVWVFNLAPGDIEERKKILPLAEKLVAGDPLNDRYLTALGGALYRAGEAEKAIPRLEEAINVQGKGGEAETLFFLALAQKKLGQGEKARLRREQAISEQKRSEVRGSQPWMQRAEMQLLEKETSK